MRRKHAAPFEPHATGWFRGAGLTGILVLLLAGATGCEWMPGYPKESAEWEPEQDDLNFQELYTRNCLACHSDGTTLAAARPMNDPFYLAWVPKDVVHQVTLDGIEGTTMPSFGPSSDTGLTDDQINALIDGIFKWGEGKEIKGQLPPYSAELGDPVAGKQAYDLFCASCHGPEGKGGENGGSVVNEAFLALISDQALRSAVVAGRTDLGMPNYREIINGKWMTDQEIADVVAWMASHRPDPDLLQPVSQVGSADSPSPSPSPESDAEASADPSPASDETDAN